MLPDWLFIVYHKIPEAEKKERWKPWNQQNKYLPILYDELFVHPLNDPPSQHLFSALVQREKETTSNADYKSNNNKKRNGIKTTKSKKKENKNKETFKQFKV